MKQIALLCAMLYSFFTAIAQDQIQIKVIDKTSGSPLAGATIRYDRKSYTTDPNGIGRFPCSGGGTMSISYVGYALISTNLKACSDRTVELSATTAELEYVEITATSTKNKALLYQPASISKLGLAEIKRGQGLFFDDAIQTNVPGVQMNRRSVAGGQQFNIRGYGNGTRGTRGVSSNFDGQGYKVYLNGIPITDAEGITTMDDIDFGSIGSAEIVKGPAGTLYGQAIAGAVNLKTITPEKGKTLLEQETQIGNYGLKRFTTSFQTADERSSILLNYGRQSSDGFAWHNRSQKDFLNFSYTNKVSDKQSFSSYLGYSDSYDERLGELTPAQWDANDYSGNIEYLKRNAHSHVTTFRASISHNYIFSKTITNTTTLFGTGFRSDVSSAGGWTDKISVNYGLRSSIDVRLNLTKEIVLIGLNGIELQRQDAQTIGYSMKQNPADLSTSGWDFSKPYWVINAATSNTATVTSPTLIFSQWSMNLPDDLTLTAGLSYNRQRITLNDRFNAATATRPAQFDTVYGNMFSPQLAINKVFNKRYSIYASYNAGYKAPVSTYFFIVTPTVATPPLPATARVNETLKPERGAQLEIGSKGNMFDERLQYQVALFQTRFSNKMTSVSVPLNNTATAYSYVVNGGDQLHKGLELSLKYLWICNGSGLLRNLTPFLNMAFSDFKYGNDFKYVTGSTVSTLDTFHYSGLGVFGVPKFNNAIGLDAEFKFGGYATISALHKGDFAYAMEKVSNNPKTFAVRSTNAYDLINLKVGYRNTLSKRWLLDCAVGINNLTGNKYPLMVFVNQLPDAFTPAPPNAVWFGGLTLKYRFGWQK